MRALIIVILALFIGQFIAASASSLWSDDENEYVLDLEEEKEDGEKKVEKEIDEMIRHHYALKAHTSENFTGENVRFIATNAEYQKVYLSTPYSPPDVIV